MHGWLFVTSHPAVVTDPTGTFKLTGVPAGRHRVEVWPPTLGKQSRMVDVKPGQPVSVVLELTAKE
jgi:hypothetical protein